VRLRELRDPADQLVAATALERGEHLITSDSRSADSEAVAVIA
jgi:predicted nucleic acid-binding protein